MSFDEDTLLTLSRIAIIRSIIEGLYDDVDSLGYLDNEKATLYVETIDDKLRELRDYIIEEGKGV